MSEPLRLSYSGVNTYQTCARKYYWAYVRKIQTTTRQLPLEFGSAWHSAMEVWHSTRDLSKSTEEFNKHYTDSPTDRRRTQQAAKAMLRAYSERYAEEIFSLVEQEQWLEIPVGEIRYVMKIDKVVNEDGVLKGLEHKTTSSLGFAYIKQFKPNLQLAGYIRGLGLGR